MTQADYFDALEECLELAKFDPEPDTPDGDRLLELVAVIEDYERDHFPTWLRSSAPDS